MKKIILGLLIVSLLIFSGSAMAQNKGYFQGQIGLDIFGELDVEYSGDQDVDPGVSFIGEYKVPMDNSQWTFGGGITYQIERSEDADIGASDFNYTSFYGLAQYDVSNNPLYFVGKLGYNTFSVDIPVEIINNYYGTNISYDESGGMFYGIGAGYTFGEEENYVFEFLYSVNSGEIEVNGEGTLDADYSKLTASVGMKF